MPREVDPSLNEKQFFAKALQENIRLDGRAFDQFRALELDFGDEYGVADVRLGKTRYAILPSKIPFTKSTLSFSKKEFNSKQNP
jgi:exosome complex RNA-binding protein Rrp42 (RNase PH superfamily)